MTTPTKRLVWALAIAVPFFALTVVTVVHMYGLPPVIAALLSRPVTEPTSEDYAVYSAFVDGFFFSDQPFRADQSISQDSVVYIVGATLQMKSPGAILPLDVVALGPNDMGEDFFRQNTRTWRLQPRFHTRLGVLLVGNDMVHRAGPFGMEQLFEQPKKGGELKWLPHASPAGPFPDNPSVSGVLQLSRAGFNRRGTLTLLYYSYRCGVLCGQSGWVVLHKTGGNWRIKQFGSGAVY
jgi:hypothetical protein